jgi:hypothetical protein
MTGLCFARQNSESHRFASSLSLPGSRGPGYGSAVQFTKEHVWRSFDFGLY